MSHLKEKYSEAISEYNEALMRLAKCEEALPRHLQTHMGRLKAHMSSDVTERQIVDDFHYWHKQVVALDSKCYYLREELEEEEFANSSSPAPSSLF